MKNCFVFLLLLFSTTLVLGQRSKCAIGETELSCPSEYFEEIKTGKPELRIFKYKEGKDLFLFMSVDQSFNAEHVGRLVVKTERKLEVPIVWKTEKDPLTMNINTKYKYDLVALLGFSDTRLLEVKSFIFNLNGKRLALGYVSDLSESRSTNRRRFEEGKGFSDHAAGCNAVVTALNSVTKEFKDAQQYCSLSTLSAPR